MAELSEHGLLATAEQPLPRGPDYADLDKLTYLACVIKEAMRMHTVDFFCTTSQQTKTCVIVCKTHVAYPLMCSVSKVTYNISALMTPGSAQRYASPCSTAGRLLGLLLVLHEHVTVAELLVCRLIHHANDVLTNLVSSRWWVCSGNRAPLFVNIHTMYDAQLHGMAWTFVISEAVYWALCRLWVCQLCACLSIRIW